MRRFTRALLLTLVLLAASFSLRQVARGQDPVQPAKPGVASRETQGDNVREITAPPGNNSPPNLSISFIDSPSVACYQPDPAQNACYINWYYMSVNANPNYMIAMTVTLNTIGIVARTHGFFQTSMYTPYNMFGNGFKVECGALGSGGHGQMGKAYAWTITAKDSSNLGSANYGSVYCPAYIP